jgi:predicted TIM-barrel fold metal-dependent hydrolase
MIVFARALFSIIVVAYATAFCPLQDSKRLIWSLSMMSNDDTDIINCHVHLMTEKVLPPTWPHPVLTWMGRHKATRWIATNIVPWLDPLRDDDLLERYANFLRHGTMQDQKETFERLKRCYNDTTKFVVLPMDLRALDPENEPAQGIYEQHKKLAELAAKPSTQARIIPFVHIDPRLSNDIDDREDAEDAATFIKNLHEDGLDGIQFKGIKLYPPLGYHPEDESLKSIWKYANDNSLPVITHCMSRGGVWNLKTPWYRFRKRRKEKQKLVNYTAPCSYIHVLQDYPDMRLCLAHFGGNTEWDKYLDKKKSNEETARRTNLDDFIKDDNFAELDWVSQIVEMLESGLFPNLYVDTSYTFLACKKGLFNREPKYLPALKALLSNPKINSRVLFGSDFYMSEQLKIKEKDFEEVIRDSVGPTLFTQIARLNPTDFLNGGT